MNLRRSSLLVFAATNALAFLAPTNAAAQFGDAALVKMIEPIRQSHNLPALGAAMVTSEGLVAVAVTGVRKSGTDVAATIDDQWHLGSDTKAMTAVIVATFIEHGKLGWDTTLGEVFPDLAATFPADFRAITIAQLLAHRAGLPGNLDWGKIARSAGPLTNQRVNAVKKAAATRVSSPPGTKYNYSNLGYVILGAITERAGGEPWETLVRNIVFTPLGMNGCGFGGTGTVGKIDQPWPHGEDGKPRPTNGPLVDNVAALGPAGTVHCSIADWSKFIADQLRGENGRGALLKPEMYKALHTPRFGGDYASGWLVTSRPWGGGTVLTHAGSNTMNFCVVWIAPARGFAVLAVTNRGGDAAAKATDEAVVALITSRGGK